MAGALAIGAWSSPVTQAQGTVPSGAGVTLLSADVFTGVVDQLAAEFERTTGYKVTVVYASAATTRNAVQAGVAADVTIVPRPMMDELLAQGRIAAGSIVDVARS